MWELDHKEVWAPKNWCFWTMELGTLGSLLASKEIKPVNPKGNQPWIFIGRTDQFSSVQSLCCVQLFVTPRIAALQASLSILNSWSLLKPIYIESVMPSNHLILFFLELFLHWSPVAYWAPTDLGSLSFSVLSFCLFTLFLGFSRQEYWSGLPFPSPVEHILSDLSTMTRLSWVAPHGIA